MKFGAVELLFGVFLVWSYSAHSTHGASVKGGFGGYLWEAFSDSSKEQSDAKTFCEGKGGWPAEPKTKELNDYLTALVSSTSVIKGHWIGLKKTSSELIWRWKNGDQAAWTSWNNGGGNKNGDYLCAALLSSGEWNEAYCTVGSLSANYGSFVCQWDLDPSDASMEYGGYRWDRFETPATFPEAKAVCSARGGWPAEPRDNSINTELRKFLAPDTGSGVSDYFIGLVFKTSKWYWRGSVEHPATIDSYENWNSGEGTGVGHDCAMIREQTGKWYDVDCDGDRKIVCQIPLPTKSIISDNYLLEAFDADGNYEEAKALCTARGQWAAEPRSEKLNDALTTILDSSFANGYLFGLTMIKDEPRTWGTGGIHSGSDYSNWVPGEPDRPDRTSCTVISGPDGQWNDIDCDYAPRRFSCQSPAYCQSFPTTCKNAGTCTSTITDPHFTCACTDGSYGGTCEEGYCDTHTDPCIHGVCNNDHSNVPFYTCICNSGYYGDICNERYCSYFPNPCQHGGSCDSNTIEEPYYSCICTPEYYGELDCSNPKYYIEENCKYHINYNSLETGSFSSSNQSCAALGGTLAMDKDSSVHEFIVTSVKTSYHSSPINCWIGGEEISNDWYWFDTMPIADDHSNWIAGEPDATGNCMALSKLGEEYKWSGEICDSSRGRICEIPVLGKEPCISSDPCVNGKCIPKGCQWRCECPDGYFGTTCENSDLRKPTIIEVIPEPCSAQGILNISWIPAQYATAVLHRIQAIPSNPPASTAEKDVPAFGTETQITLLSGLRQSTQHTVSITVCPDECIAEANDQKLATTGVGLPDAVGDVMVEQTNVNANCKLSWSEPTSNPNDVEGYTVTVTASMVYQSDGNQMQPVITENNIEPSKFEFTLAPEPNREYSFEIAAKSCAGIGPKITATGDCVGGNSPPDLVPTPGIIEEPASTSRQIVIVVPDESNGPISCLLVIAKSGVIDGGNSFDVNDLREVSSIAFNNELYKSNEYLALAIPRKNVTESLITAELGDGTIGGCNVELIQGSRETSNDYYGAQNWGLEVGSAYSFYVATSTPVTDDVTVFETSEIQNFQNGTPVDDKFWIIGVVFGVLAVIGAIVVGIYIMRKRQSKGESRTDSTSGTEGPYQQSELYEPAGYDNVQDGKIAGDEIEEEHPYLTIPANGYENVEPRDKDD